MKTFYLFKINDLFLTKYENKSLSTYKILKNIYNNYNEDLFFKFLNKLNKEKIDINIYLNHKNEFYYYNNNNKHIIDNAYEYVKMEVFDYCIIMKTNKDNNTFLNDLNILNENLFLVDFENNNYFWVKDKKICYNY